jgi:hypothetical protein
VSASRRRGALILASGIAALVCTGELLWLRSTRLVVTPVSVALLFLPWLAMAAINLSLWHWSLSNGKPSPLKSLGVVLFWLTSAAFAAMFSALYGALVFGWV